MYRASESSCSLLKMYIWLHVENCNAESLGGCNKVLPPINILNYLIDVRKWIVFYFN